jgi:hypothetical protein
MPNDKPPTTRIFSAPLTKFPFNFRMAQTQKKKIAKTINSPIVQWSMSPEETTLAAGFDSSVPGKAKLSGNQPKTNKATIIFLHIRLIF